jgi:hypothetical protein
VSQKSGSETVGLGKTVRLVLLEEFLLSEMKVQPLSREPTEVPEK